MSPGMVDITSKEFVYREARAEGYISLRHDTLRLIEEKKIEKGDVIEAMKIAAINAVKNTPNIIPYCHPIKITNVSIDYHIDKEDKLVVGVTVKAIEQTGVEMEALTGVTAALLCVWDMVKKYEKDESGNYPTTRIGGIHVVYKKKVGI